MGIYIVLVMSFLEQAYLNDVWEHCVVCGAKPLVTYSNNNLYYYSSKSG
jgi:hypothetical protein